MFFYSSEAKQSALKLQTSVIYGECFLDLLAWGMFSFYYVVTFGIEQIMTKFPLSDTRDLLKCYLTNMGFIADVTQLRVWGYSSHN